MVTHDDMGKVGISLDETYHVMDGRPIYAMRFQKVTSFHEPGIAAVDDGKYAYFIDLDGTPLFGKVFQKAFGFYQGLASVEDASGWYHVDITGNPAYEARYCWTGNFQEGLCPVHDASGPFYHIKPDGSRAYDQSYHYAGDYVHGIAVVIDDNGKAWHVDRSGNKIHDHGYPFLHVYHKGYAVARDKAGYFHVNKKGIPAYDARFTYAEPFYNGQALVRLEDGHMVIIDECARIVHQVTKKAASDDIILGSVMGDLTGFWKTQTLHAATKIGLITFLHDHGPTTVKEINDALQVNRDGLERLVNALEIYRYVKIEGGKASLDNKGRILHDRLPHAPILWGEDKYIAYALAAESIKTGQTAYDAYHGSGYFSPASDRKKNMADHQAAFAEYARIDYQDIARVMNFSVHPVIMDVGGGHGVLMDYITRDCPAVKGIVFDRPEVIQNTRAHHAEFHAPDRIQLVDGDFFDRIPSLASCIIMSRVLHDWNDELALKILHNAWVALPAHGNLYIIESLKLPGARKDIGITLDLHMYLMTGGKERTLDEYKALIARSKFKFERCVFSGRMVSIIVASKQSEGE